MKLLEERKFKLSESCNRALLRKNIITMFESGYVLAVNPQPTMLDILMIF